MISFRPPRRCSRIADLLDDDFGELMALAGRIPSDVTDYMKADPKMPEFLRRARARKISAEELMALLDKEKDEG
jgi:HTH-type transcriptional regulator, competence development regulator